MRTRSSDMDQCYSSLLRPEPADLCAGVVQSVSCGRAMDGGRVSFRGAAGPALRGEVVFLLGRAVAGTSRRRHPATGACASGHIPDPSNALDRLCCAQMVRA